ncbi:hypothetical protein HK102_011430, partial [Quaeritorhiza haematococci]
MVDVNTWGPAAWKLMFLVAVNYPESIDESNWEHIKHRERVHIFFENLQHILPCRYCRDLYARYLREIPPDEHLKSRKSLVFWVYTIKQKVNQKLGKQQDLPFERLYDELLSTRS